MSVEIFRHPEEPDDNTSAIIAAFLKIREGQNGTIEERVMALEDKAQEPLLAVITQVDTWLEKSQKEDKWIIPVTKYTVSKEESLALHYQGKDGAQKPIRLVISPTLTPSKMFTGKEEIALWIHIYDEPGYNPDEPSQTPPPETLREKARIIYLRKVDRKGEQEVIDPRLLHIGVFVPEQVTPDTKTEEEREVPGNTAPKPPRENQATLRSQTPRIDAGGKEVVEPLYVIPRILKSLEGATFIGEQARGASKRAPVFEGPVYKPSGGH
ncbi:MAG: hypothetical protein ACRD42_02500 [Nitrososphaeraceae archaeon]